MKAVKVEDLEASINGRKILRDISFEVEEGELFMILGPNGAGKSTLLKCISGIIKCKGDISILGSKLGELRREELARMIAYVPQRVEPSFLRVFEFVLLGRRPYMGLTPRKRDLAIVRRALKMLGIEELEYRPMRTLSGGELQKVAIARALAQETPIILLDEPTNNLDPKSQVEVMRIVERLTKQGKTVISVMHDLMLAFKFGKRFMFLKEGRIVGIVGKEELEERLLRDTYEVEIKVATIGKELVPIVKG
ncbi:iron (III) ABC transporter, atp-binding protein [Pyrococcus sp. NA2]|uniref:ABC transporter ATP-binding protein n=1 Tax=Pyrococcus sp. (strain NA2) TaxID=342949 RepID=UPI000209AAA5|nr:ABC transporter ATP-binding protein [Pyrococcus sp. NA2]AEC52599.1 iron (III) ABC transporter, atp-binding protein [Pyrococcus sp. NA2]